MLSKITVLFILVIGATLFQPLIKQIQFLTDDSTITGALISSFSTILGNIIGGVITGYVAFFIAKKQLDNDKLDKTNTLTQLNKNNKKLILKEIETNNKFLSAINVNIPESDIVSILKYSISDRIFFSIKSQLPADEDFSNFNKYYLFLYRLQNDPVLHDKTNIALLQKEINRMISIKFETPL